jgi:hypothetical protein
MMASTVTTHNPARTYFSTPELSPMALRNDPCAALVSLLVSVLSSPLDLREIPSLEVSTSFWWTLQECV